PGYRANYQDRNYLPKDIPANAGFSAADRHFSQARMNPELLMIESDHDLRNPADFLVLDKLTKAIFRVPGISRVQAITRPDGMPMDHTSIAFQISMQNAGQMQAMRYQRQRMDDFLKQADEMAKTITHMRRMYELMTQLNAITHRMAGDTEEMKKIADELR